VSVFLGIDGGGTKTACCLLDREGRVVAQAQAPSSYYFTEGIELVGRVLRQGVDEVCRQAGLTPADIAYAFVGLPSYGEISRDLPALDAAPGEALGHHRYACGNDMICGWAGSLGGSDGINVISGTGSMTYGERAGRGARVGGWGELFGDEGSAYWIAIRGLNAFSRMSDGVLPSGPLHGLLRERLGLESDFDLIDVVLNRWQGGRGEIAELSRAVVEAASAGDTCAAQILADAAEELAGMVEATRRRLSFEVEESVPVSFSGGMFTAEPVLDGFKVALETFHSGYELREPLYPPVVGAALYAAKLAGEPLDAAALSRLRSNSQEQPQPS
jgi:N-acetylglucosamine kinase-like BadF-type ATPase